MRETDTTVEFDATDRAGIDALIEFDRRYGSTLEFEPPVCAFTINDGVKDYECDISMRRVSGELRLTTTIPRVPPTIAHHTKRLERELNLDEWERAVREFPSDTVEYSIEIAYQKHHDIDQGHFVVYSIDGVLAVRREIRKRLSEGTALAGLTLLTPLAPAVTTGSGILIAPLDHAERHTADEHFLLPEQVPEILQPALALIQADHVGLLILQRDFGEQPQFDLPSIRKLAEWVQSHKFRRALVRRYLEDKALPETQDALIGLTNTLALLEEDLVGGTLKKFETASATFREISVELLRDLHKMRGEILSLVGSELFQMSVTIALTVAGLSVGDLAAAPVIFGVSLLVGVVFFGGALLKASTQEKEFRHLVEFNREFESLPVALTMPPFRRWYITTVNQSIDAFYKSLCIGIPLAGVPLYGVIALAIDATWPDLPLALWATFSILASAMALGAAIYWKIGPRARLRLNTLPASG